MFHCIMFHITYNASFMSDDLGRGMTAKALSYKMTLSDKTTVLIKQNIIAKSLYLKLFLSHKIMW